MKAWPGLSHNSCPWGHEDCRASIAMANECLQAYINDVRRLAPRSRAVVVDTDGTRIPVTVCAVDGQHMRIRVTSDRPLPCQVRGRGNEYAINPFFYDRLVPA